MRVPTFKMLGSKARLATWIIDNVPNSNYHRWIEPFAGRGNVFFRAARSEDKIQFKYALLNDAYMAPFLTALRDQPDFQFVDHSPIDKALYTSWQSAPDSHEKALAESYVCRMGGSFAWNSGTNTTCDKNKHSRESTISRMQEAQRLLRSKNAMITSHNWDDFLIMVNPSADDIIYVDPPYNTNHKAPYPNIDHASLLDYLNSTPATVMLSGYDNPLYQTELKSRWCKINKMRSSTARAGKNVGIIKPRVKESLWIKQ